MPRKKGLRGAAKSLIHSFYRAPHTVLNSAKRPFRAIANPENYVYLGKKYLRIQDQPRTPAQVEESWRKRGADPFWIRKEPYKRIKYEEYIPPVALDFNESNMSMMDVVERGPSIIDGLPATEVGMVQTTFTDPKSQFSHHRRIPYALKSNIERVMQPLVIWEEFNDGLTLTAQSGGQTVHSLAHPQLLHSRIKQVYWKLARDVPGMTLRSITNADNENINNLPPLLCHGMEMNYRILSTSNTAAYLEFWEFECTDTSNQTPLAQWNNDLDNTMNVGMSVLPQNTVDPPSTAGYTVASTDIGRRPVQRCKNLWTHWRVVNKKKVVVPAGATVNVKFTSPGYAISHEDLLNHGNTTYQQGLSRHHLIFHTTECVYDNATGTQAVGMGTNSLSYRWTCKMKYSMPPNLRWYYHIKTNATWAAATTKTEFPSIATANQGRVVQSENAVAETITLSGMDT